MEKQDLIPVLEKAVLECGCTLVGIEDDGDNNFDVTISRPGGDVRMEDCEHVHRAVLDSFDRDVEDYALTVGSAGIPADEADEMLKSIKE